MPVRRAPIEAPHRFDLVGVAREMRSVEIRVRDDGGHWSNWVEQEDGTPIYAGKDEFAKALALIKAGKPIKYEGVIGPIKFDAKGQASPPVYITQWCEDGRRRVVYPEQFVADCGGG